MYRLYLYQHHPSIDPKQILVTISIRNGTFTVMLERKLNWRYQFFDSMLGGSSPQSITLTGRHFFRIFNLQGRPHDLSHQTLGRSPSISHRPPTSEIISSDRWNWKQFSKNLFQFLSKENRKCHPSTAKISQLDTSRKPPSPRVP